MLMLNGVWLQRQGLESRILEIVPTTTLLGHGTSSLCLLSLHESHLKLFLLYLNAAIVLRIASSCHHTCLASQISSPFLFPISALKFLFQVTAYQEDFASEQKASAEKLLQLQNSLVKHQDWIKKLAAEVCPPIISMYISTPFLKF